MNIDDVKELAIKYVKLEQDIVDRIMEIEARHDPDGDSYLDEGQQAELYALYGLLDRDLNEYELEEVEQIRKHEVESLDDAIESWSNAIRLDVDRKVLNSLKIDMIKGAK